MANNDAGQERSEKPTGKRRSQAREEGQIPRSTEISTVAVLVSATAVLLTLGVGLFGDLTHTLFTESARHLAHNDAQGVGGFLMETFRRVTGALAIYLGAVAVPVIFVNALQARGVLTLKPITPKISNLNPMKGFKRVFGTQGLFNGFKATLKVLAIGTVTYFAVKATLPDLVGLSGVDPIAIGVVARSVMLRLAIFMVLAYLVLAAIDAWYQQHKMEKDLMMTRQEVIYERKDSEGNPLIKSRILAVSRTLARSRMMREVPTADVVVVNPIRIAVALKYDLDSQRAPVVVAMGQRKLAARIREIARKNDVPIVENVSVARALLATAKVGRAIPPALYAAVAEILAYVYRQRGGWGALPRRLQPARTP